MVATRLVHFGRCFGLSATRTALAGCGPRRPPPDASIAAV